MPYYFIINGLWLSERYLNKETIAMLLASNIKRKFVLEDEDELEWYKEYINKIKNLKKKSRDILI